LPTFEKFALDASSHVNEVKRRGLTNVVILWSVEIFPVSYVDQFLYHEWFLIFKLLTDFQLYSFSHIDNSFFEITCFWLKSCYFMMRSLEFQPQPLGEMLPTPI